MILIFGVRVRAVDNFTHRSLVNATEWRVPGLLASP